jgi:hypothetical protein
MDLSADEVQQRAEADRREDDPPIQVVRATWSKAGQLNWWVKDRQEWWRRVRGANGRQGWIRAADLRPASSHNCCGPIAADGRPGWRDSDLPWQSIPIRWKADFQAFIFIAARITVLTGSGLGQQNASTRNCCSPIRQLGGLGGVWTLQRPDSPSSDARRIDCQLL